MYTISSGHCVIVHMASVVKNVLFPPLDLSLAGLYGIGLAYGGPAVLIWGWVLTSLMTMCVGLSMSELASAFPVSGGLYFWAFMLGRQCGPFASWCVGWMNFLGQVRLKC